MNKLTILSVQRANKSGLLTDGGGLALQITRAGTKSWVFRYTLNGRKRMMGLGAINSVTLAEAREIAGNCRKKLHSGIDPVEDRNQEKQNKATQESSSITFDECAESFIAAHRPSWRNQKHGDQWVNTIRTYVSPFIGKLPVKDVNTELIMNILEPIWIEKNETASRIRSRLELILAWAKVRKYRSGENPAIWRNHLDKLLASRKRVRKVKHFTALSFEEINEFIEELRKHPGLAPKALEFLILTACRTGEVLGARWIELNLNECTWTIPAERMKTGAEHQVPLSKRAMEIIYELKPYRDGEFVFPSKRTGKPLSNMAMLKVIERMEFEVTAHGFRSTFRDWAAERTNFANEVCEQALAHSIRDKVESAYRRGNLFLKRQVLMNEWSKYCNTPPCKSDKILQISSNLEQIYE